MKNKYMINDNNDIDDRIIKDDDAAVDEIDAAAEAAGLEAPIFEHDIKSNICITAETDVDLVENNAAGDANKYAEYVAFELSRAYEISGHLVNDLTDIFKTAYKIKNDLYGEGKDIAFGDAGNAVIRYALDAAVSASEACNLAARAVLNAAASNDNNGAIAAAVTNEAAMAALSANDAVYRISTMLDRFYKMIKSMSDNN